MKQNRILAALLIAALLATSCGSDDTSSEVETLKVAVLPVLSFAPYYIAEANGYFADENLELEFIQSERGTDTIPLLIQGDIDVWNGGINAGFLNAAAAGEPLRLVADKGSVPTTGCAYSGYVASSDILDEQGNIDVTKIVGTRVGGGGGMTTGYAVSNFLGSLGLDTDDITFDPLGMSSRVGSVEAGHLSFASVAEPWITRGENEGLIHLADDVDYSPGLTIAAVGFGPNMLTDKPDIAARFMRAYLRGVADYQAGPTPEHVTLLAEVTEVDSDILEQACWPAINPDGSIDTDVIAEVQEWGMGDGQLERIVEADEYYDPSFAEAAFAEIADS
jgi:NitT/TauT family transport system substrate-binding protein